MTKRVAVIGQAFRFPGTTLAEYWDDLLNGKDLVTAVDADRWDQASFKHPEKTHPGTAYTFAAGSIGDVSGFDAAFFGISPREAALMDPQQRLLLEMSWETLENAGVKASALAGSRCGVFIGIASSDYSFRLADDLGAADASTATGNTASIAANRLSYVLDLRGPSMAIDTACSSSLVAFHQACQSIRSGESTHALAGGVSLHLHPYGFIVFSKASMLSRRGRCNVFDADADGYVRSEGGGLFLLKDYEMAVRDGDRILAVVANSAVNTDGKKSGMTIPSYKAQASLLQETYAAVGIAPADIDYMEAHGTGTAVGDPIETRALGDAIGRHRSKPLLIGSVKSNLGHMEAASGVAGLVKAIHAITHRKVPATIGVKKLNPNIPFDDWNLSVVTQTTALKSTGKIVIGCNSFGFGGANAHVILESPPVIKPTGRIHPKGGNLPLLISGKDAAALQASALALSAFLERQPQAALYDIAYQAAYRRDWHAHRAVLFGATPSTLAEQLRKFADAPASAAVATGVALNAAVGPAFVYTGNGSQWAGMGSQLLEDATFRKAIVEIDALFAQHESFSIEAELRSQNGKDRYALTEVAQPALFALQVGVTRMLREKGIVPVAVTGHSVGEVAAAWASGALSLEDAVQVIYHRSRLQGLTRGQGGMTAVSMSGQAAQALLDESGLSNQLAVAGFNSSTGATIAGPASALAQFETMLKARNILCKRLDLDYAFHSAAMDGIEAGVRLSLADIKPRPATIPFYSTVTGQILAEGELDAGYWWHNIRRPVLFEQAVGALMQQQINVFVEIGPHPVLRSYLNNCLKEHGTAGKVIGTLSRNDDVPQRILDACGQVMLSGATVEWSALFPWTGQFVDLPHYSWQREACWHPVTAESSGLLYRTDAHPLLGHPLAHHELTWESPLDTHKSPMLADHVVGDATVFPGTGFVELALAAGLLWHPGALVEVEDLEIRSPLLLGSEHAKIVRLAIAPQDGSFTVTGRELGSSEAPVVHAVGRLLTQPTDILLEQAHFAIPTRHIDFTGATHGILTLGAGLNYGPAFQAIEHGWIDGDTVSAALVVPPTIADDMADYHLHPALLDCALQLIIQLVKDDIAMHADTTFVPTMVGRIALREGAPQPRYARVNLLNKGPHSLFADVTIFDADGAAIAVLQGVRFRSIRLQSSEIDHLRFLEYRCIAKPLTTEAAPGLHEILKRALSAAIEDGKARSDCLRFSEEVDPLLDGLSSRFSLSALGAIERQHLAAVASGTPPSQFARHLLSVISEDGLVDTTADGRMTPSADAEEESAEDIWKGLVAEYPDYFHLIHAVGRVGLHLPDLLAGETTLADALPQEATLASLSRHVLGAAGRFAVARAAGNIVSAAMQSLAPQQRLRIMEISEGGPSFIEDIGALLDFDRADYVYASTAAGALEEADRLRELYPALTLESLTEAAGSAAARNMQLVFLTLDFADVQDALRALQRARDALVGGGSLLVLSQHPSRWMDFVLGQTPTWWSLSDAGLPMSRQQPAAFWQHQLAEYGFMAAGLHEFSPDAHSGAYFLLARREAAPALAAAASAGVVNAITAPAENDYNGRHWLLLADASGTGLELARKLSRHLHQQNDRVRISEAADALQMTQVLTEMRAAIAAPSGSGTAGSLAGVVFLSGLGLHLRDDAPAILRRQTQRCAQTAALMQACDSTGTATTVWIVTGRGAPEMIPADTTPTDADALGMGVGFADAALWGFGRTLMNEAADCDIRLVDLRDPAATTVAAAALALELQKPDAEQEVILGAGGARFVPRLQMRQRPDTRLPQRRNAGIDAIRLGFPFPGQLRNLQWEAYATAAPEDDELEVEVHATGLNFRDVMYALGLLSDEAIENGFAGPTLGLEFSGIVKRAGKGTTGYARGDLVVGFGPSSFGDRVMTKVTAVSHIPNGMTFEAAATIPSAFFTVYYALHYLARLTAGEKVLIHGAAGGVGIAAIQMAQWCGAEIYATAGSDEKRDFLRLLGVKHIFDSRSFNFADEILQVTGGKGVDVVLNSLAGEAINRNFRVLKPFGRFLELGKRDFYENTKVGLRPFRNNISYFGIDADQLMVERPEFTRQLFGEMMALFSQGVLSPLPYQAFEANQVIDAFRYMQQAKQIGKVVITYRHGIGAVDVPNGNPARRLALPAQATYLVTGGLSGFGLKTAERLASLGARNLLLISRSGSGTDEAQEAIDAMRAAGVHVVAHACDVTDRATLAALFADAAATLPPIRGVVHAAMVIDDGLIRNTNAEQIRRVLAPKILGAQYLHELTQALPLDFYVLYSSGTTLFGNPGQSNYVAANSWLEAHARARRAAGLPATCVRWGAIDDVGFLARNQKVKEALQSRMGGRALSSSVALDALEALILTGRSGEGVLEIDWRALSKFLPSAGTPKFSEMARGASASDNDDERPGDLKRMLDELPDDQILQNFGEMLQFEVGEILRVSPDKIDPARSLYDMGLDSLMGLELVMALEARFGIRLPVMALSESQSIAKLAERILALMRGATDSDAEPSVLTQVQQVVALHAADVASDSVAAFVDEIHAAPTEKRNRMIH